MATHNDDSSLSLLPRPQPGTTTTTFRRHDDLFSIHIAITLNATYLRCSIVGVFSVLQHANCPENIVFHFIAAHRSAELRRIIVTTFPYLSFHLHHFDTNLAKSTISLSIRSAVDQLLNYARIYLADLNPSHRQSHHLLRFPPNRSAEMENREVHVEIAELDEDTEETQNLPIGFTAIVLAEIGEFGGLKLGL